VTWLSKGRLFPACLFFYISVATAEQANISARSLAEIAIYPERSASATVVSLNNSPISAQIDATVASIPVKVGYQVKEGDLLVSLECQEFDLLADRNRAELARVQARIILAEQRFDRSQSLLDRKLVSQEDLDSRQADLDSILAEKRAAAANLNLSKLNQSYCEIKSPMKALVTKRMVGLGQYAKVGTELVELLDIEDIEISAQVYSEDANQLNAGSSVVFEQNGRRYPLRVRALLSAIDSQTRNREVRLLFSETPALPGSSGKIVWRDTRPHVPPALIVERNNALGIFVSNGGVAEFHAIKNAQAGRANPIDLPITARIIYEGYLSLEDRDSIVETRMGDAVDAQL